MTDETRTALANGDRVRLYLEATNEHGKKIHFHIPALKNTEAALTYDPATDVATIEVTGTPVREGVETWLTFDTDESEFVLVRKSEVVAVVQSLVSHCGPILTAAYQAMVALGLVKREDLDL